MKRVLALLDLDEPVPASVEAAISPAEARVPPYTKGVEERDVKTAVREHPLGTAEPDKDVPIGAGVGELECFPPLAFGELLAGYLDPLLDLVEVPTIADPGEFEAAGLKALDPGAVELPALLRVVAVGPDHLHRIQSVTIEHELEDLTGGGEEANRHLRDSIVCHGISSLFKEVSS